MYRELIHQQGFAVVADLFSDDEIENLVRELAICNLPRSRAGIRHAMSNRAIHAIATDPRLLKIPRDVLGDKAIPFRATLFDKSPDSNWLVVWHQDTALPLKTRLDIHGWGPWSTKAGVLYAHAPASALQQVLALRIHLDDSTDLNGPLRVLPGTHTLGVLTDDVIHDLSTRVSPVACTVNKGGVLAMRPLVVHSSSKSETQNARRVLHIEYAIPGALPGGLELAVA